MVSSSRHQVRPGCCLYIVDWYNKIISHNEVPRTHPDRDKTRGRIWRVKHKDQTAFPVPDFAKLGGDELLAKLGGPSLAQSHLAWQAIVDRREEFHDSDDKLTAVVMDRKATAARRVQALWASQGLPFEHFVELSRDPNASVRRESISIFNTRGWSAFELAEEFKHLLEDSDPTVRAEYARWLGRRFYEEGDMSLIDFGKTPHPQNKCRALTRLLAFTKAP
jgi:hypothetical protein